MVSVLLIFVGSVAGFAAPTVEVLLVARAVTGIGVGFIALVVLSGMADAATDQSRGQVMSLIHMANSTGIALYPLVGGAIGLLAGWRATFLVSAILALACGAFLWPALRQTESASRHGSTPAATPSHAWLSTRQRIVSVAAIYAGVIANHVHRHGFRNTFVPLYAATVLGLGVGPISVAIALMAGVGLLVAMPGGMLSDRIGRKRVIVLGLMGVAAGEALFFVTGNLVSFLAAAAVLGCADFFSSSQTALLSELAPPAARNRVLSGYRFSVDLGAVLGPILVASILDAGGPAVAIASTMAVVLAAAALNEITLGRGGEAARARMVARSIR